MRNPAKAVADAAMRQKTMKSFTSRKFDWLHAVSHDPAVKPWAFEVAFSLASHWSSEKNTAFVSDETVADQTALNLRTVRRGRKQLKMAGWISWKRTPTANVYIFLDTKLNAMWDSMIVKREKRKQRRDDHSGISSLAEFGQSDKVETGQNSLRDLPTLANGPANVGRYTP